MVIYNITIKVDNSVAEEWVKWMKTEHMAELVSTGLFFDCRLCRLLEQDETEGPTFAAQYFCDDIEQYNTYIEMYAEKMREKGIKRFGNKYVAFRTILETL